MARICRHCGLPLDEEHHDVVRVGPLEAFPLLGFSKGARQRLTYVRRPRRKVYGCRVRLVATEPDSGRTVATHLTQRVKRINNRWARPEALEAEARNG